MDELLEVADSLINAANRLKDYANAQLEQNTPKSKFLNMDQAAAFLGLARSYVAKLVMRGELTHYKPNGRYLYFLREDLEEWQGRKKVKNKADIETELAGKTKNH